MSFSHYDEDGVRTSHRTYCCIGARRATHCATGDDWLATVLNNYLDMVVSVVKICSRTILQSTVNNSCTEYCLRKITVAKYEHIFPEVHSDMTSEQIFITFRLENWREIFMKQSVGKCK